MRGENESFRLFITHCDCSIETIELEGIQNAMNLYEQYRNIGRSMGCISLKLTNSAGARVRQYHFIK